MSKTPLPEYSQLARWTVNDVCTWLMENRFGSYVSQFREHGIDGGRFAGLKDVDLSQMRCPLNKRTDLLKCIRAIPNRDVNPPTLQKPVSNFVPSSRAPPPPRTEDRRNKQLPPPQNDIQSDSDDDYEAWGEFDDFDDHEGSSDEDYENNENHRNIEDGLEPQEDYANYEPDQTDEGSTVTKNGHSITDSLRQALEKRNRVNQERPPPDEPAIPPRPARPGRGGNVPAPQRSPAPPRQGRRGREMIPTPEPEDQPDYEVPEEVSKPSSSRPPRSIPHPVVEDQPTYEDPDETDHAPPPVIGRRPPAQRPMELPPQTHSDMPEDVYEDPDQTPTPAAPKRSMPPVPRHKEQSLARTISEPDQPAPPPPRHGNDRHRKPAPPPTTAPPRDEDSDDSNSNWRPVKKSDYEKPEPSRPSLPAANKHRQKGLPPRPPENDYMAMAEKAKKSDEEEEDYEKPDPAELPPGSRFPPTPPEPKSGLKSKGRPPMPLQTESGKKLPAGAVPIIGIQPEVSESPKLKHSSRDEDIPPAVPSSRPHGRPPLVKEGRSLPPTPSNHRGPIETPSSNKNQVRDSVIDRPPPPIPGNEGDITQQPWYQNVNRAEADVVLKNFGKNGTFLIRPSTKAGQPYTLQIYNDLKVYNLPIRQKADSTYALGREKRAEETFKEVQDLVDFFRKHTLILAAGGSGQTRLKYNCPKI